MDIQAYKTTMLSQLIKTIPYDGVFTPEVSLDDPSLDEEIEVFESKDERFEKIRSQISFYMSDSNLCFDKFMRKVIGIEEDLSSEESSDEEKYEDTQFDMEVDDSEPKQTTRNSIVQPNVTPDEVDVGLKPVPLCMFLVFRKITRLTKNEDELADAFRTAEPNQIPENLIFNAAKRTVQRKQSFNCFKEEVNERSIYVENLPVYFQNLDIWIEKAFGHLGTILSIRVHRYGSKRKLSGSAFVEFSRRDVVSKVIRYFTNFNKFLSSFPNYAEKPLTTPDNTIVSFVDLGRLRIMSKNKWINYKNQYKRLQRYSRREFKYFYQQEDTGDNMIENSEINRFCHSNIDDDEYWDGKDEKYGFYTDNVNIDDTIKVDQGFSPKKLTGCVVSVGFIVNAASTLNNNQLRKSYRAIFSKHKAIMPQEDEIIYLDVSHTDPIFLSEGNSLLKHQTFYIRVVNLDAANKLITTESAEIFEKELYDIPCKLALSRILSGQEVLAYWNSVEKKRKNK